MTDPTLTQPTPWRALLIAYALHLAILALFVFSVIPQEFHPPEHAFWFHNGGDNVAYFELAHSLWDGDVIASKYPLGYPILLLPFVALFPDYAQWELLQVVAAVWSVLLFPVGQWALLRLADRLLGRRLALVTLFTWTALPLLVYGGVRVISNPTVAETASVHLTWAQMLSDGPAALLTLLALLAFFRLWEADPGSRAALMWAAVTGALVGFLALVRLTGGIIALAVGLPLLARLPGLKSWRSKRSPNELGLAAHILPAVVMAAAALLCFLPQMVYNTHFFGGPLTSGYTVLDDLPSDGLFSLRYLLDAVGALWDRLGALLIGGAAVGLGVVALGVWQLWQRRAVYALVVGLWLGSYAVVYGVYYYSWVGGLPRFLIPAYPAAVIVLAAAVGGGSRVWTRRRLA